MSRHVINGEGTLDINASLHGPIGATMRAHAEARDMRPEGLLSMILLRVLGDDLVGAVLDDGK